MTPGRSIAAALLALACVAAGGCAGPSPDEYFAGRAPDTGYVVRVWDSRLSVGALAPLSSHLSLEVRGPGDPEGRGEIFELWGWGESRIVRTPPPNGALEPNVVEDEGRRRLVLELRGEKARASVLWIRNQMRAFDQSRLYVPVPGPNSNTFIVNVLRECPGLRIDLPPTDVGKDWAGLTPIRPTTTGTGLSVDIAIAGVQVGLIEGVEVHVLGMTFGVSFWPPALKLPFGRLGVPFHVVTDAGSAPEPE